jgi:SMC interacting uncharacterized protein involved in chromosome segregation
MPINKNKPSSDTTPNFNPPSGGEEGKDGNMKYSLSKFEYDLYHEEDDKSEKVIRVKRISMPNKGEKWKVMNDNKVIFIIEGSKISKKEKEYLQTVDGFNFILTQAKMGIKSLNSFRSELKKIVDKKPDNSGAQKQTKPAKTKKRVSQQ